jgi:hypothetical protein
VECITAGLLAHSGGRAVARVAVVPDEAAGLRTASGTTRDDGCSTNACRKCSSVLAILRPTSSTIWAGHPRHRSPTPPRKPVASCSRAITSARCTASTRCGRGTSGSSRGPGRASGGVLAAGTEVVAAHGQAHRAPALGTLCYAPFDQRVIEQMRQSQPPDALGRQHGPSPGQWKDIDRRNGLRRKRNFGASTGSRSKRARLGRRISSSTTPPRARPARNAGTACPK